MIRTQIYLTEDEKKGLELASAKQGKSQSDLIRQAIDDLLAKITTSDKTSSIDSIAGIWKDNDDIPDIRNLRAGWNNRSLR